MVISCRFWYGKSGIINIFLVFSCLHILLNNQNNKNDKESVKHWTDINYKIKNNPTPWYVERYLDPIIFTLILTNFSLRLIKGKKGCKNVYLLHCVDWVSWNYWPVHETDEITLYKKDLAGLNYKKVKLTSQYLSRFLRPISSLLAEIWLENTHNTLHGLIIV